MRKIWNRRDLELAYLTIKWAKESDLPLEDIERETKKAIREFTHRKSDHRIVKDYGIDGFVELIELPEYVDSDEGAEEYFEANERRVCMPSQYDCTGQSFTNWHKICKRRGRYYLYHSVSFDV